MNCGSDSYVYLVADAQERMVGDDRAGIVQGVPLMPPVVSRITTDQKRGWPGSLASVSWVGGMSWSSSAMFGTPPRVVFPENR
jgi:hypothetical protein